MRCGDDGCNHTVWVRLHRMQSNQVIKHGRGKLSCQMRRRTSCNSREREESRIIIRLRQTKNEKRAHLNTQESMLVFHMDICCISSLRFKWNALKRIYQRWNGALLLMSGLWKKSSRSSWRASAFVRRNITNYSVSALMPSTVKCFQWQSRQLRRQLRCEVAKNRVCVIKWQE